MDSENVAKIHTILADAAETVYKILTTRIYQQDFTVKLPRTTLQAALNILFQ